MRAAANRIAPTGDNSAASVAIRQLVGGVEADDEPATITVENVKTFFNTHFDPFNDLHWDFIGSLVTCGVWIPLRIVVARPFIEHQMYSSIMLVAGSETGNTLLGPSDFQVSANTTVKTIEGHYTCHTKAVVTRPENVYTLRDIMCCQYVAGCGDKFFGEIEGETMLSQQRVPSEELAEFVQQDMRNRLDFANEHTNQYGSMFAFVCPYASNSQFMQDRAFSLSEQRLPWEVGQARGGAGSTGLRNFPGEEPFFRAYQSLFNLNYLQAGQDSVAIAQNSFVRSGACNNIVLLQGPHRVYDPFALGNRKMVLRAGFGHFGKDAKPGDARWRNGQPITVEQARASTSDEEILAQSKFLSRERD